MTWMWDTDPLIIMIKWPARCKAELVPLIIMIKWPARCKAELGIQNFSFPKIQN